MNRILASALLPALISMTELHSQTPDALAGLIAAERAFARTAADSGMKHAFLSFLDDEGIIFRPDAQNGRKLWSESPETPAILAWDPDRAEVSADGTLGYTTGPWTFRQSSDEPIVGSGTYISVWRRNAQREWKVMVDLGIAHERLADTSGHVATTTDRSAIPSNAGSRETERDRLHSLEVELAATSSSSGFAHAVEPFLADDSRFNRNGLPPVVGRVAVRGLLLQEPMRRGWEVRGWDVAGSLDLGYAWGTYQTVATETTVAEKGSYLRVWRRNRDGEWSIALEVTSPLR